MRIFENVDCIEGMEKYPDKYFNLCFTDPPYNVGLEYNSYNDTNTEYYQWCDKWFNEVLRVCETVVFSCGYKNLSYWLLKKPKGIIIWHKVNQNSPSPLGGFNVWEPILYFGKTQKRIGHDLYSNPIALQKDAAFHRCPKHLDSWKEILNKLIDKPAKVLDIFAGSGSTLLACDELGLDYVGFELDKDYYNSAKERLEKARFIRENKKADECFVNDLALFSNGENKK